MLLEDRKQKFKIECSFELKEMNQDLVWGVGQFFDYWTEHSPNSKKLRFEFERVFCIKKRFATWERNFNKWNKPTQKTTFIDKVIDKQQSLNTLFKDLENEYNSTGQGF